MAIYGREEGTAITPDNKYYRYGGNTPYQQEPTQQNAMSSVLNPDTMGNVILPLLSLAEVIGSRGRSRGEGTMGIAKTYRDEAARKEDEKQRAVENQMKLRDQAYTNKLREYTLGKEEADRIKREEEAKAKAEAEQVPALFEKTKAEQAQFAAEFPAVMNTPDKRGGIGDVALQTMQPTELSGGAGIVGEGKYQKPTDLQIVQGVGMPQAAAKSEAVKNVMDIITGQEETRQRAEQAQKMKEEGFQNQKQLQDERLAEQQRRAQEHADLMKTIESKNNPAQLTPEGQKSLAQKVIDGEWSFQTALKQYPARMGKGVNKREIFVNDILRIDPNWDEARSERDYNVFNRQKSSDQFNAIETFLPNIKRFEDTLKSIPNQTGSMTLNKLMNTGQFEFGGKQITNARTLAELLAIEMGRSVGSGKSPTDQDMKAMEGLLSPNKPLSASLAGLETIRQTEVNRHVNLALQGGVYGEHYVKTYYSPEVGQMLIDSEKRARVGVGSGNLEGSVTPTTAPESQGKYTTGQVYTIKGKPFKYIGNNQWEAQ